IPNAIKPVESNIPIEQKKKEIIFVGRFDSEKGLPKLLKIWEMVQDELPEWNLIMVGDGGKYKECAQMIADKKLKRVQLTGYRMSIP
ncbi:glycosyltransferase, partial [Streptococcus danieliae]|nr:glycosyltransferase [Streptococcus danieliae]